MKKLLTRTIVNNNALTNIVSDDTMPKILASKVPSLLTSNIESNAINNSNESSNYPLNNEKNSNNTIAMHDANEHE